jgi:two-component system phosphate regulon sensor histidine kinase PhoR
MYSSMTRKQDELGNERHKLQHVFSILNEGIILLDTSHRIKHFNSKAAEHLGSELTHGRNIVDSLNSMDTINFVSRVLEWQEDGIHHLELRQKMFDVHVRYLDKEILIVLYNITERTQYEDFKTELIGNITHELKTPLAMIMGYAETLLANTSVDRKNLEKFLTIIHSNSKRLNNIINDILELHRLEHIPGGFRVDEPLQLEAVLAELNERYEGFETKTVFRADCTDIPVLREHFMTLLTNLTDNAHKYSLSKVIEISISVKDDETVIQVADEGPVIPDEDRERIFERFYTVNKSKNRNQTGTGLGLSIVKHITGLYDGSITLEKNKKGGNTFVATLFERPVRITETEEEEA